MPSYQDATAAEPSEFTAFATQVTAASGDLIAHIADYGTQVGEINGHWRDTANEAFNSEVESVVAHLGDVGREIAAAAAVLKGAGLQLVADCSALKIAETLLKGTGFDVLPSPLVALSAAQRTFIATTGPLAGFFEAALQTQATAGTMQLQSILALVNAGDATAGDALDQIAQVLRPLEDKRGAAGEESPGTDSAGDDAPGSEEPGEATPAEEPGEETEEEAEQTPAEDPAASEPQQPETPQTPQDLSGLEDPALPETPDLENPWDASELPDPDDLGGGLASGGGLGGGAGGGLGAGTGGLGAGAGSTAQGGMGTGLLNAPAAAPASGSKTGTGAMMGAGSGGGRGAAGGADDGHERESTLVEDPDEDVWGIAKAADDLYE
jgi:uncharacterized protein YukE